MTEPHLRIGIMYHPEIIFRLNETYLLAPNGVPYEGIQKVNYRDGKIWLNDELVDEETLVFNPVRYHEASFELNDVTIGIQFHWERKEDQTFKGSLEIMIENDQLTAINILPLEDYLVSVISSEMSATSNMELLKAHAIVSRSWMLAQTQKSNSLKETEKIYQSISETPEEYIRWYDREDHLNFDVCADDHCQRYQGITRQSTKIVEQAVAETRGMLLMNNDKICDARFSKSCGGISETFENVWEPEVHPYLQSIIDNPTLSEGYQADLTNEEAAQKWIRNAPEAFCNTHDKEVLSQVLNDYDQETTDFYRWKLTYQQTDLAELIARKSGRDFGSILDLIPVERGFSGRLIKLKIVGSKLTLTIGKELEIRKTLSESHLYSSAFVVDKQNITDGIPGEFILTGAGWGHGVGLCQIGAAMMGAKGYKYDEILLHYFRGASISKEY
ncbi:amidase enhancer [Aquipluma nitroreducens]|uniref:Amidase enhancer n=1 Tax=Aquipluma nitroreducens TaxID=2010828 RepID=A0A5K7SDI9_9BACT|nr:SpoIID/LytB domain-containing protein [Aquipluma nitroreducens]BBE19549.1 amidase enhancer [Aquipluma nitroreducens]